MIIILALLVPIVPFVIFGEALESAIGGWLEHPVIANRSVSAAAMIIMLLAVDILLPIPSTLVCTVAGKVLGPVGGTLACWLGLNLSAGIGYWLARRFGWPLGRQKTRFWS